MNNICFIENIALKQIPIKTQTRHMYSSINLENSSIKNSGKLDIAAIIIQGCTTPSLKRDPLGIDTI